MGWDRAIRDWGPIRFWLLLDSPPFKNGVITVNNGVMHLFLTGHGDSGSLKRSVSESSKAFESAAFRRASEAPSGADLGGLGQNSTDSLRSEGGAMICKFTG